MAQMGAQFFMSTRWQSCAKIEACAWFEQYVMKRAQILFYCCELLNVFFNYLRKYCLKCFNLSHLARHNKKQHC